MNNLKRLRMWASNLKALFMLMREALYDSLIYFKSAMATNPSPEIEAGRLEASIIRHYHVIEKGLCMPDFRYNSGRDIVKNLIRLINRAEQASEAIRSKIDDDQIGAAVKSLRDYRCIHEDSGIDVGEIFAEFEDIYTENISSGGIKSANTLSLSAKERDRFFNILESRVSTRHLDPDDPPCPDLLKDIARIALTAPSACNRQSSRIHYFLGDDAQALLKYQGGNRGFGHTIPAIAIITSDLRCFHGQAERYQGWIDGGMFSMQFLLALHGFGMGGVSLNWSANSRQDRLLREASGIKSYERIIMMIGFGKIQCNRVPFSKRKSPEKIMSVSGSNF